MADEPPPQDGPQRPHPTTRHHPPQHQHYGPQGIGFGEKQQTAPDQSSLKAAVVQSFTAINSPASLGGNIGQAFSLLANAVTLPLSVPSTYSNPTPPAAPPEQRPRETPTHPAIPIGVTRHIPLLPQPLTPTPHIRAPTTPAPPSLQHNTMANSGVVSEGSPQQPTEPMTISQEQHDETTDPNGEDEGSSMDVSHRAPHEVILIST